MAISLEHNPGLAVKVKLHSLCVAFVEERIASAKQAILQAQASANEETKSSAGDKYETGRAMAQLEIENNAKQLAEASRLIQSLGQIRSDQESRCVQLGSVVYTNQACYYIAISAGRLVVDGVTFLAVSPASPVGMKLMNLGAGATIDLQGKSTIISKVI